MEPVRTEFVPRPGLEREAMAALQREVAAEATFADDLPFDPATIRSGGGNSSDDSDPTPDAAVAARDASLVAGVDQAFLDERAVSAIVVVRGGEVVERTHAFSPLSIPYVPGLLAFREGGPIVDAVATLSTTPDLFLFDGSGRIHYRQAGLATHLGVVFDVPAVGVAKSLLCGEPGESVADRPAGWRTPIRADDEVDVADGTLLGYAVQTRQWNRVQTINPVYVSPGHRVGAETAADIVERLCVTHKLPEPIRLADSYADEVTSEDSG